MVEREEHEQRLDPGLSEALGSARRNQYTRCKLEETGWVTRSGQPKQGGTTLNFWFRILGEPIRSLLRLAIEVMLLSKMLCNHHEVRMHSVHMSSKPNP